MASDRLQPQSAPFRSALARGLLASAVALSLTLLPVELAAGSPERGPGGARFADLHAWVDALAGLGQDAALARARQRYRDAIEDPGARGEQASGTAPEMQIGDIALRFSPSESRELIARGWLSPALVGSGFDSPGQRLRTMIDLARRLGYGARVGALQAGFGTPYEIGIAELEVELVAARRVARAAPDDLEAAAWVEELEAEIAVMAAAAKPGQGPSARWARADLDVNGDGSVDPSDLAALDAGQMPPGVLAAGFTEHPAERCCGVDRR